ncbi:MAG: hypothetical protein AAFX04_13160 [Pseudomonadota bacterium]
MDYYASENTIIDRCPMTNREWAFTTSGLPGVDVRDEYDCWRWYKIEQHRRGIGSTKIATDIGNVTGYFVDKTFKISFRNWLGSVNDYFNRGLIPDTQFFQILLDYRRYQTKKRADDLYNMADDDTIIRVAERLFSFPLASSAQSKVSDSVNDEAAASLQLMSGYWHVRAALSGRSALVPEGVVSDAILIFNKRDGSRALEATLIHVYKGEQVGLPLFGLIFPQDFSQYTCIFRNQSDGIATSHVLHQRQQTENGRLGIDFHQSESDPFHLRFLSALSKCDYAEEAGTICYKSQSSNKGAIEDLYCTLNIRNIIDQIKWSII